jgi:hypothetical protein
VRRRDGASDGNSGWARRCEFRSTLDGRGEARSGSDGDDISWEHAVFSNRKDFTMTPSPTNEATAKCEAVLRTDIAYNMEHSILPGRQSIAQRMLARRIELAEAYTELYEKLGTRPQAVWTFFDALLAMADLWNPAANAKARANRRRLEAVNTEIEKLAAALARLLEERDALHNTSGFHSNAHYHPLDLIDVASVGNQLYEWYPKKPLDVVRAQYGMKYWPSISECIMAISINARDAGVQASNPFTGLATQATRNSLADCFKVLFGAIEQLKTHNSGFLPQGFFVSDASLASLVNCALDLGPDDIVDAAYVKRLRQRERAATGGATELSNLASTPLPSGK